MRYNGSAMHVLFITSNRKFLDETSEEALQLQAMVESAEALHVVVFTLRYHGHQIRKIGPNAWIYPTNSLLSPLCVFDAWRTIRLQVVWKGQFRVHVIHSDDPFAAGWLGYILARRNERAWVVNIHCYLWGYDSLWHALGVRLSSVPVSWIMRYAEHVCVYSEQARLYLMEVTSSESRKKIISFQKRYDPAALRRAPITIDLRQKYPEYNFIILVCAPLTVGGHVGLAIDMLARLHRIPGYGRAGLVVVGRGPLRSVHELKARTLGVKQWVRFEHAAKDLASYCKSANVLLYLASGPEEDENVITAAAAGCAIVALPSAIASGIIRDGENGLIVQDANDESLTIAIRRFNEVPGLRERFKLNSAMHLGESYIATTQSLAEQLRLAWSFEEAPPEEAHLEHELSFPGAAEAGKQAWRTRVQKLFTRIMKR